jgi:hypothetical protein
MGHSVPQNEKELQQQRLVLSMKRDEKYEERSLIKKRGLAIRYGKKLHLSKSPPGGNNKEPCLYKQLSGDIFYLCHINNEMSRHLSDYLCNAMLLLRLHTRTIWTPHEADVLWQG